MRTETNTFNVFKFNELPDKAKEKAIEHFNYINVEYLEWHESIIDYIKETFESVGLKIEGKVYFSTDRDSYIEFEKIYFTDVKKFLLEKVCSDGIKNSLITIGDFYIDSGRGYRHKHHFVTTNTYTSSKYKRLEKKIKYLTNVMTDALKLMQEEALSEIRKEYEYLTSLEAITETIEVNEYEFLEDGSFYR